MKNIQATIKTTVIVAIFISLTGCAGMSRQGQGTLLGAGAGALGGAALTGGSAVGTLGGAAVGGLIGNVVTQPRGRGRYRR
ncbi:MAG: glycine zipper domain-containing protein [Methylovulum sp.]|nr:glycine zipper domain-containing protein [Methylovulum sp.]